MKTFTRNTLVIILVMSFYFIIISGNAFSCTQIFTDWNFDNLKGEIPQFVLVNPDNSIFYGTNGYFHKIEIKKPQSSTEITQISINWQLKKQGILSMAIGWKGDQYNKGGGIVYYNSITGSNIIVKDESVLKMSVDWKNQTPNIVAYSKHNHGFSVFFYSSRTGVEYLNSKFYQRGDDWNIVYPTMRVNWQTYYNKKVEKPQIILGDGASPYFDDIFGIVYFFNGQAWKKLKDWKHNMMGIYDIKVRWQAYDQNDPWKAPYIFIARGTIIGSTRGDVWYYTPKNKTWKKLFNDNSIIIEKVFFDDLQSNLENSAIAVEEATVNGNTNILYNTTYFLPSGFDVSSSFEPYAWWKTGSFNCLYVDKNNILNKHNEQNGTTPMLIETKAFKGIFTNDSLYILALNKNNNMYFYNNLFWVRIGNINNGKPNITLINDLQNSYLSNKKVNFKIHYTDKPEEGPFILDKSDRILLKDNPCIVYAQTQENGIHCEYDFKFEQVDGKWKIICLGDPNGPGDFKVEYTNDNNINMKFKGLY